MQNSEQTRNRPTLSSLHRILILGALAMLLSVVAAAGQPQPVQKPPSDDFTPIPGYFLTRGGEGVPQARFYHSPGLGRVLIHNSESGQAWVIDPRRGRVSVHEASDFEGLPSGDLAPPTEDSAEEVAMKTIERRPAFTVDGVQYRVQSKSPLLGPRTAEEIVADDPYYGRAADRYQPAPQYLDELRQIETPTRVLVFFGSWCKNCHKWLPNILAVEEALEDSEIRFEYHGLPQGKADPVAQSLDVRSVPFGVIFQNGEEVGRIGGPSWRFPDLNLLQMLGDSALGSAAR